MRKLFAIILLILAVSFAKPANAIIDIMATIQSGIELKTEITNKIEAYKKMIEEAYKKAVQGFDAVSNCLGNPMKCDIKTLASLGKGVAGSINTISGIRTIPGAEELAKGNLKQKDAKDLDSTIIENYTYIKGQGDDLARTANKRKELNAVMADDVAILFAKGIVVRQSIRNEEADKIYSNDIGPTQSDVLAVHNTLILKSQERLSRILELRAYMVGAEATTELARNSANNEELEEQLDN